jgi:hypothetical protein
MVDCCHPGVDSVEPLHRRTSPLSDSPSDVSVLERTYFVWHQPEPQMAPLRVNRLPTGVLSYFVFAFDKNGQPQRCSALSLYGEYLVEELKAR